MRVKRVVIVRHGETDYNATHRYQGQLDIPLNAVGQEQAKKLAHYIKTCQWNFDAIYSSDLLRASSTAQAVADVLGLEIIGDVRLREVNAGIFQGNSGDEMSALYPHEMNLWKTQHDYVVPEGESWLMVRERVYAAWLDITAKEWSDVMIVAHGGTMRELVTKIFPPQDLPKIRFGNTSMTIIERDADETLLLKAFAITPHLE